MNVCNRTSELGNPKNNPIWVTDHLPSESGDSDIPQLLERSCTGDGVVLARRSQSRDNILMPVFYPALEPNVENQL